jgi:hypothetical protein
MANVALSRLRWMKPISSLKKKPAFRIPPHPDIGSRGANNDYLNEDYYK